MQRVGEIQPTVLLTAILGNFMRKNRYKRIKAKVTRYRVPPITIRNSKNGEMNMKVYSFTEDSLKSNEHQIHP